MCLHPIKLFYNRKTGKYQVVYDPRCCDKTNVAYAPCRKCEGCRECRKSEVVRRIEHELQFHEKSCFITLTVNEENMEKVFPGRELSHRPFQLFMKRLRKITKAKFTYLMCGEYGSKKNRPHYHAILFGLDFDDKTVWQRRGKYSLYRSETLEKVWKYGFSTIGQANGTTGGYLTKYVLKQMGIEKELQSLDEDTGELIDYKRPYMVYPRSKQNGGLGYRYYLKNCIQMFERGYIQSPKPEIKLPIPGYYKRKFEEQYPDLYEEWKKRTIQMQLESDMEFAEREGVLVRPEQILVARYEAFKKLDNPILSAKEVLRDVTSLTLNEKIEIIKEALFLTREAVRNIRIRDYEISLREKGAKAGIREKRNAMKYGIREVL